MTHRNDFAYSVGLIRTLETLLLNENEVERMMLAGSAKEAFKILNEFDYADNKAGIENAADFQKVIDEGLIEIKEILNRATPDKNILNILWFRYDFHNIKAMIKALLSGKSFEDIENLMNKMGSIPIKALRTFIFEGTDTQFKISERTEAYIKKKIKKVQVLFEKENSNPQVIDLYLDQKLMKIVYGIAQDSKSEFLLKYVKTLIDLTNIKLLFRMKSQEKEIDLFEIAFLWNGNLDFSRFREAYKEELNKFPELFNGTKYAKVIAEGYIHYEEEKTFIYLEKEIENHLIERIKSAKLMPFGPEPLIAYFLAKQNNALIIRMIMISKLNEIDPEEIKKRLRKLYS